MARALVSALELPLGRALGLAHEYLQGEGAELSLGAGVAISIDRGEIERRIRERLLAGAELTPPRRRGRPPGRPARPGS
ncbi:MAG: hypothetical protein JWO05_1782 [Gemmatimonadetes bacterium]|nr:hypothetical protein [Gemmatimonadota bacterium]